MSLVLNYDWVEAVPLVLRPYQQVQFWIVGCGGTGSFLVQLIARLANQLIEVGKPTKMILVDPDRIEPKNISRQCFCASEIGHYKAQVLAMRYSLAWNIEIEAITRPFEAHWLNMRLDEYRDETLIILLGCVDRASGRRSLHRALDYNHHCNAPRIWWIDSGNGERHGQVLVGSSLSCDRKDYSFSDLGCLNLPSPGIQAPELLVDKPDELEDEIVSCADLALQNEQSLFVNVQAAAIAADLALELIAGKLKRYAVYFDLASGSMESRYITQKLLMRTII